MYKCFGLIVLLCSAEIKIKIKIKIKITTRTIMFYDKQNIKTNAFIFI